ncbi:MAG TPA: HEAT repeat domain-containing protein [Gemmatimonadales bacterium]|nr:HEAT repeat domain-containing protein [Gemmatimonadales bacterium]
MDANVVEAVLAEVGKAFRVCRFYPAGHPAVKQAMADLTVALPSLATEGTVELRIGPAGFALGNRPLLAGNAQVQEFANLLYAAGHRAMSLEPGVTADEFVTLMRQASGGAGKGAAPAAAPRSAHIGLEGAVRKPAGTGRTPVPGSTPVVDAPPTLGARSTGVFRPNALPPEIEVHRLAEQLEGATPAAAITPLGRLGAVASGLAAGRDVATLAEAVTSLAKWAASSEPAAAEAARVALAPLVTDAAVASMVGLVAELKTAAAARQTVLGALSALGDRAVPAMFDAYVAASDPGIRELWARALLGAGGGAARHLADRATMAGGTVEALRAAATLLSGTGAGAVAVPALVPLVRHDDAGVRRAATAALARLGGSEAGRAVIAALRDKDAGVRLEAARGAAALGDKGFGAILLGRLKDESDEAVGLALIEALGKLQEAKAVPALADLARESGGMFHKRPVALRVAAIRALVSMGSPDALAAVAPFRSDKQPEIRSAAQGPGA